MDLLNSGLQTALKARERAHTPYSHFKVGAALHSSSTDRFYPGCNVENASYGATICAERNAILRMQTDEGAENADFIVIAAGTQNPTVPCAMCLQVMAEFFSPGFKIYLAGSGGIKKEYRLGDLLPHPFTTLNDALEEIE